LILLRKEIPESGGDRGLLREEMIDELVRHRPTDEFEFREKIPLHLRLATDGKLFNRDRDRVFEILVRSLI
jgi:hypothetical protein